MQAGQKALARSLSNGSAAKPQASAKAIDSDSSPEQASRALLRSRAGNATQSGRQSNAGQSKSAQHASSDSDDDVLHNARTKQTQLLASRQPVQAGVSSNTFNGSNKMSASSLAAAAAERRASRDSVTSRSAPNVLLSQTSVQRQSAAGGNRLAGRLAAAADAKPTGASATDTSDADSDEEHWKSRSARAVKPKSQLQVTPTHDSHI